MKIEPHWELSEIWFGLEPGEEFVDGGTLFMCNLEKAKCIHTALGVAIQHYEQIEQSYIDHHASIKEEPNEQSI